MRLAKITSALVAVAILVGFGTIAIKSGATAKDINFDTPKLQSTEAKLKSVNIQYESLNTKLKDQTSNDKKTIQDLKTQQQRLEKQREDLKNQLQAKADEKSKLQVAAANAVNTVTATSSASAASFGVTNTGPIGNCGDNYYASYIYGNESGGHIVGNCNPTALNSIGCLGIGQACPASKLLIACPNSDYACENQWFTGYAQKYCYLGTGEGCWEGAYYFWIANHWW